MPNRSESLFMAQLKQTNAALDAARNYIKLLESGSAAPLAVGIAKANYVAKLKDAIGVAYS